MSTVSTGAILKDKLDWQLLDNFMKPAWVIILVAHGDWIAASIEAGGIPAI